MALTSNTLIGSIKIILRLNNDINKITFENVLGSDRPIEAQKE